MKDVITKSEIKFWLVLVGMALAATTKFTRLQSNVMALADEVHDKGATMRSDIESMSKQLNRMENNQILLMHEHGIAPTK